MTNSTCYLYVNTTLRVKTYLHKLVKAYLAISLPQVPYPDWALGLFFWKEMRFILSIKSPVVTPPTTSNWVCYLNGRSWVGLKFYSYKTQIQDLELKYFQFNVCSPTEAALCPILMGSCCPVPWIRTEQDSGVLVHRSFLYPPFLVCRI